VASLGKNAWAFSVPIEIIRAWSDLPGFFANGAKVERGDRGDPKGDPRNPLGRTLLPLPRWRPPPLSSEFEIGDGGLFRTVVGLRRDPKRVTALRGFVL
jgi:hypothetical protein